jgi:hypothetical protein
LETIVDEEGLREYARVHTDGSVIDEQSGCAIVKIRFEGGENQIGWTDVNFQTGGAGNKDHKKMGVDKRIIMSDVTLM